MIYITQEQQEYMSRVLEQALLPVMNPSARDRIKYHHREVEEKTVEDLVIVAYLKVALAGSSQLSKEALGLINVVITQHALPVIRSNGTIEGRLTGVMMRALGQEIEKHNSKVGQ